MKYFIVLFLAAGCLLNSCIHHNQPADLSKQDSLQRADSNKTVFLPVAEYLEADILHVDSIPLALRKYITRNGQTDSAYIQVPEFNALALQFVLPELRNGSFEKNFTENSFMDKTTQSVTFTYATTATHLSLQRVDVTTSPGINSQKVKSIYMEKNRVSGDSLVLEKMYWRMGRSFQVSTMTSVKGKSPIEQQLKVVWDDEEDD
jgi:hypothetical protein